MFNLRGFNILPLGHGTPRVAERKPGIQVSGESPGLIEKMKGNKTILTENSSPLEIWAKEALGLPEVQVQVRLRGNHLHILCEAEKCPEMSFALAQFSQALSQIDIESLLPPSQPRIYQMFLCGRTLGRRRPDWTVKLDGNKVATQSQGTNAPSNSDLSLIHI